MQELLAKDVRPKPFVFVLMPFKKEFDDVYELGIRETCEKIGLHCERADKQIFEGSILERVYNQIDKADIIVADMTGQNPNVFYETGYAHALGKRVILLTQNKDDIPFDLVHYPHVIYSNRIVELRPELERRLQWLVDNPRDSLSRVDLQLELFMGGANIEQYPELPMTVDSNYTDFDYDISLHYKGLRILQPGELEIGVVVPENSSLQSGGDKIWLPDGSYLYMLAGIPKLFPDGWHVLKFTVRSRALAVGERLSVSLRVFTELGARDYPIHVVAYTREDRKKIVDDYHAGRIKGKQNN